jgi:hypothetical protein
VDPTLVEGECVADLSIRKRLVCVPTFCTVYEPLAPPCTSVFGVNSIEMNRIRKYHCFFSVALIDTDYFPGSTYTAHLKNELRIYYVVVYLHCMVLRVVTVYITPEERASHHAGQWTCRMDRHAYKYRAPLSRNTF